MKTQHNLLRKVPHAALAAIMSLSLILRPAYAVDSGVVLTGSNTIDNSGAIIDGNSMNGYFLKSGSLNISNATLQNFKTIGGDGSGGGAGFGGAIFINSGASVTLNNVNFLANQAVGGNGGVGLVGGTLNGGNTTPVLTGPTATNGANGYTPNQTTFTDIGGTTGTKGYNGANSLVGFGGAGGAGGNGGNGGDRSIPLILGVTTASTDVVAFAVDVVDASSNPFTINVGIGLAANLISAGINLGNAVTALVDFDQSLSDGQSGLGGGAGKGGIGGNSGFGFGGAPGGNGGNGGLGGANWSGSAFHGGAAGGDAGDGGNGGMGGFGAGGGKGGNGGLGGGGAGVQASAGSPAVAAVTDTKHIPADYTRYYTKIDGTTVQLDVHLDSKTPGTTDYTTTAIDPMTGLPVTTTHTATWQYSGTDAQDVTYITTAGTPAIAPTQAGSRPDGLDGAAGGGGLGGFGGGGGASGTAVDTLVAGGSGGNGYGGGIFVRSGATLTITGNALFDGNGVRGGQGQLADSSTVAGQTGIGVGTDIFMMTGSTVNLNPGAGNVITFNGNAYNTSIADDSAASIIAGGGATPVASGKGADIHIQSGLVQFNGANVYSGQTIIEGGSLQAQDGTGIYWDSNINFKGTTSSDAVLMSNGNFTRYVGAQSNRVQWNGSGGFAASGGDLTVTLSNNQTMKWGSNSFVPSGSNLVFGSLYATNKVNFQNNIDLNGANQTILVTANDATLSGVAANTDTAILNGVLSNGSLTINDASHSGILILGAANTFTGTTTVANGGLALSGAGSLVATDALNLSAGTSFDISGITASSQTLGSITAATGTSIFLGAKNLTVGDSNSTEVDGIISDGGKAGGTGGSLTKQGSGTLTLTGANTFTGTTTINAGTVALKNSGSLASPVNLAQSGATLDISGTTTGTETIGSLQGVAGTKVALGSQNLTVGDSTNTTMAGAITDGGIAGGAGGSVTKAGSGTMTLTGTSTYTGATTINAGTVVLSGSGTLSAVTEVNVANSGASFDISALTNGGETIGSIASAAGATVVLGANNLTAGDSGNTTVAGVISGMGGSFTKTGSGTTTFTAANTYSAATTITNGGLVLSGAGSLASTSDVSLTSSNSTFDISGITATSETIGSLAGVSGSNVILGAKNLTTGDTLNTTMAGVISGTNGSLTKQGSGQMTLTGANTYTGDTTVSAGTLATSGNERIANASDLIVASGATFLLGGTESLSSISGAGSINLQSNTLVSNANVDTTFSGVISGTDSSVLTKTGTGKLTLSGANTYTGTTNFNGGSADLTGSLESKTVNVASGVTLDSKTGGLSSLADLTNNGTINLGSSNDTVHSYTSTGTINGPGTLTALNYNLNGGSVVHANLGSGTITTNGNVDLYGTSAAATIVVNAASVLNLKAPELILNTASVTVNGTLNLDYTPAGTETFQTLLGSGIIHTNGNALVVADGGSFTGTLDAAGATLTTGGGSGGGGGGGGLTLGGGTTTTQSTEIDSGLTIGSGATLNSTTIVIANGSVLDLSGGGTVNFTTLSSVKGGAPGIINIGTHDFIIPFGSTLAGNITFIGTGHVINNGTIAPGFSPGFTVLPGGAQADNPGSIFNVQLAANTGVDGVDFDQKRVPGSLTVGGTLNVSGTSPIPGPAFQPAQGNSFQVISTNTLVGGHYTSISLTGSFATVTYDPTGTGVVNPNAAGFVFDLNTGKITTTGLNGPTSSYADLGSNANQRGAASALFSVATAGHQNQIDSSTTAGKLALQITDSIGNSSGDLARYTPDYYGSLADYAFMGNQVLVRSIQDRVSPMSYVPSQIGEDSLSQVPETMSLFMGYTYANLNTSDAAKATRNDYYAGVNLLASEDYVFGIAGSASQGSISAALGSAKSEGWGAMMFGRYTVAKSFTFFGSFGFNQQNMDLKRQTVNGTVTGSTDVTSYVGFLGVQYKGWRVGGVSIAPRMSFSYSNSQVKGFNETGAIDALNVGGYNNNRFMGEAGVSALWSTELAGRAFNLEVAASVQQYFLNSKSQMAVQIASVPSASYGVNFAKTGSTQAVFQVNAGYEIAKAVTAYVGYEGHFGNQTTQYAKAGIRVNF
jgi:fibronectin-binding autotransporter adhesin